MSKERQIFRDAPEFPESWIIAMATFFVGGLAGVIGPGVLIPLGYNSYGNALLWIGACTMIGTLLIIGAVFFRLWKPPGITEIEW